VQRTQLKQIAAGYAIAKQRLLNFNHCRFGQKHCKKRFLSLILISARTDLSRLRMAAGINFVCCRKKCFLGVVPAAAQCFANVPIDHFLSGIIIPVSAKLEELIASP
jgi:hypothetical protein